MKVERLRGILTQAARNALVAGWVLSVLQKLRHIVHDATRNDPRTLFDRRMPPDLFPREQLLRRGRHVADECD
jgi:hypothetical protein